MYLWSYLVVILGIHKLKSFLKSIIWKGSNMKALCKETNGVLQLKEIPKPEKVESGHLIVQMATMALNPGDKTFLKWPLPPGAPTSRFDVYGFSGVGKVVSMGSGVPKSYEGQSVMVYRSLKPSEFMLGTWCEYSQLHYLNAAVVPSKLNLEDYSGSLVNLITSYSFLKQAQAEGHSAILCTAGTSATGMAMLGYCLAQNFPLISIVRTEEGKKELQELGAQNVLVSSDPGFKDQLAEMTKRLKATVVFEGVGGELLSRFIDALPQNATVYAYGSLGGAIPSTIQTMLLYSKGLTLKGFGNFQSATVQNPVLLEKALGEISALLHQPHFKTKLGKAFTFDQFNEAVAYVGPKGEKPVLTFRVQIEPERKLSTAGARIGQ
jgi:NADPH2:quinone reductase